MAKFENLSLVSSGWKVSSHHVVVPLTERYQIQGYAHVLDYAKALCECHLKPNASALLIGFADKKMFLLADFKGQPDDK